MPKEWKEEKEDTKKTEFLVDEEEQIDGLCAPFALISIGHTMNKHKCGGKTNSNDICIKI